MSSSRRNFRRRGGSTSDDEEPTSTTANKANKPSSSHPPIKALLSFADDEDAEDSPFTRPSKPTSKPSSTHKLSLPKNRIAPIKPSNVHPQPGLYTKEALLELQKNTRTLAAPKPKPPPDPVIVLKGLVKPVNIDPRDEEIEFGGEEKGEGVIMDQARIDAIRAERERLRQRGTVGGGGDYIALDMGSNHGEVEGLSDEEPEFRGRIGFFGDEGEKKGVFEEFEERVVAKGGSEDEDEDEEDKMWEEEQVRKGLGKRIDAGARVVSSGGNVVLGSKQTGSVYANAGTGVYSSVSGVGANEFAGGGTNIGGAVGGLPGLDVMTIGQEAEIAKKALHESLRRLKETHCRTVASLTKTDDNLSASLSRVVDLEDSLSAAGEKYIFMQKLRDFLSVICEYLQDRAPFIEEVEAQLQKLHQDRAAAVLERRSADNDDEMKEIEAAVDAAMSVLSKSSSNLGMVEAATSAATAAASAARELRDLPVKLDEFGRDMNLQTRMDISRRADTRQRRRAKSDAKRLSLTGSGNSNLHIEGESSTDESDSESTAYQSNRDQLLQVADHIFSNADEEYSKLSAVVERFERWKKNYASAYRDAYMSLSVPAIFSPYVRLELLKWDPLHEDADFSKMEWYSLLFSYGLIEDESKISEDDSDANLIPELVEKVAIPILHHQIENCWDLFSTHETELAVSATNLVFTYVPLTSSALGKLVAVLRDRLSEAVDKLMIPTWNSNVLKAVPNAARLAAYRFGMSVRLMRNICLWNNILARTLLEKLALDDLLSGKVLPHLRSIQSNIYDAVIRSERVIVSLHGVWAGPSVMGDKSLKLQPMVKYILTLGKLLEKKQDAVGPDSETGRLARRLKKMLVDLNEYDNARAISRTFNLKEAL
ncbi:chromatin/chromatin-binding, or -regulatory protein [Lithospermum erythrorhizon]|uniref:Chromatin/chromatin-binding, or -regulatory protein n=1 Tax=Lithospermum erythrorhizon TaxID=34254 RepID=A0AAV3P9L1_LITER